jgi:hypothetical protein
LLVGCGGSRTTRVRPHADRAVGCERAPPRRNRPRPCRRTPIWPQIHGFDHSTRVEVSNGGGLRGAKVVGAIAVIRKRLGIRFGFLTCWVRANG